MRTPIYPVTRCNVEISVRPAITLPKLVMTAARPTTECNAATVCGNSVAVIRRPMMPPRRKECNELVYQMSSPVRGRFLPIALPAPATAANCNKTSMGKPTAARDARIPELTPRIPSKLPRRAVAWEARPEIEPIENVSKHDSTFQVPKCLTNLYRAYC